MKAQENFQQEVNYKIKVKLNDKRHTLSAFEEVEYLNNSTDTLKFIYFHLWPNAYKNQKTALAKQLLNSGNTEMYFAKESDLGYIDSLEFKCGDAVLKIEYDPINIDVCKVILNEPLLPGKRTIITTPFHVKLPSGKISRCGHVGQAYTITQWYPKPAVYDRKGWHPMPYLDQGEFYSEYGSFEVDITLPRNYVLAATGDRVDAIEEEKFMDEQYKITLDKIKRVNNFYFDKKNSDFEMSMEFPESDTVLKTVKFKQYQVHDFAWFCDKRYNVLQGEVILPQSMRTVKTWALFTNNNFSLWEKSIEYLNDATFFYSLWNGDYPYLHVTAVDGTISAGGGMEYPNITVIGESGTAFQLETVIMHEVGHNWFYGILGSNERENAWMDEGINSFNEMRYIRTKYPGAKLSSVLGRDSTFKFFGLNKFSQSEQYNLLYQMQARQNKDQACQLHSAEFTGMNYGAIVYSKTAVLMNYLYNYLGEESFDATMRFYFDHFKFKHPQPEDFRRTFEYFTEKDLSWFFDDLINTTKKLDYKICKSKQLEDGSWEIVLKNKGEIAGPVPVMGLNNGKLKGEVWCDGFKGKKSVFFPPSEIDKFIIDYRRAMPDFNVSNNYRRTKGLFKSSEKLKLRWLGGLEEPERKNLFYTPIVGFNEYNGLMIGIAAYNHFLFRKKVEWDLAPMYSFNTADPAGFIKLQFNSFPKKVFQEINLGVRARRFAFHNKPKETFYLKINPYLNFQIKKKDANSPWQHSISINAHYIQTDQNAYHLLPGDSVYSFYQYQKDQWFGEFQYTIQNTNALFPWKLDLNYQATENMSKAGLNYILECVVNKKKSFWIRFFAGTFIDKSNTGPYRFRMSGIKGNQDYLYNDLFLGRNEYQGLWNQQFVEGDGGIKVPTYLGQSNTWLCALNLKSPTIYKIPVFVFADAGICDARSLNKDKFIFDAGLGIRVFKNIFEIYVPLAYNKDIQNEMLANNRKFYENIRFTLNLNNVNPLNLVRDMLSF